MRKSFAAAVAALAVVAPAAVSAQAPILGLRIGFAVPFGDIASGTGVRDIQKTNIPLQIDAGFKFGRAAMAGVYLAYGFGQLSTEADRACGTADCDTRTFRIGAQGAIHSEIRPGREVWAGVMVGWERLHLDAPAAVEATASGWELGLQGGFDFASGSTGFGPFMTLTAGRFGDFDQGGVDVTGNEKLHGTIQLGVRGYFQL